LRFSGCKSGVRVVLGKKEGVLPRGRLTFSSMIGGSVCLTKILLPGKPNDGDPWVLKLSGSQYSRSGASFQVDVVESPTRLLL
jgi:hypothetical protein